jgi:hypothetical protein
VRGELPGGIAAPPKPGTPAPRSCNSALGSALKGFEPNRFGAGGVPLGTEAPPGVEGIEVVLGAEEAFGFPGEGKVDVGNPPKGLASGSRPAPRIIDAICNILRTASGLDLLANEHGKRR